ncbi:MAG: sugar phosphate nucleotidyltransferase [Candidatus ainarchaeum sp.]|nr:sugar phosphate nucleotidyltransferase [Candidatus ainarchaeum sp.]
MKVVVLAAGKGIRMKPLTDEKPKAMVELKGKPLLERSLEGLKEAGASEICLVVGYLKEQIKDFFGNNFQGVPVFYVEQKEQLGTGHAFLLAKKFCGKENFLASYCDLVFEGRFIKSFFEFAEKNSGKFYAVVAVRKASDVSKFGLVETDGCIVKNLVEKPKQKKPGLVNAGLYWFSPKIFDEIEKAKKSPRGEIEITTPLKKLASQKRLGCFEVQGKSLDIGTKEELEKAEKEFGGKLIKKSN